MKSSKSCKWRGQSAKLHEDPWERRGDRTGPRWAQAGRPRPAGPAHFGGRFSPVFLAPEGSLTLKAWRRHHHERRESFAPEAIHKLERERGGGSPEGEQPPRRKHPQVEKKEDTVGRETMINGAMTSTFMG
jgi:hypothetical protein